MYEYRATIVKVVDGDTVHADIDMGFDAHIRVTLRLAGINAPEMGSKEGVAARDALRSLVENAAVTVKTKKDRREKFGRYLATLFVGDMDVNARMIADGHAVQYYGGA